MRSPDWTPWGAIQEVDELFEGIYLVTTAGHGGIMVEPEAVGCLSAAARKCGVQFDNCLCFEEDCDEKVVLRELMDGDMWWPPEHIKDVEAFEAGINKNLQEYHPEYWKARNRRLRREAKDQAQPIRRHEAR